MLLPLDHSFMLERVVQIIDFNIFFYFILTKRAFNFLQRYSNQNNWKHNNAFTTRPLVHAWAIGANYWL